MPRTYKRNLDYLMTSFRSRVAVGNILDRQHFVVPIKTRGRAYGTISKQFTRRYPGIELPDLELRQAKTVTLDRQRQRTVTFSSYWDEESEYTPDHMALVAGRALSVLSLASLKLQTEWGAPDETWTLSMPLFKGAERSVHHIATIEDELIDRYDALAIGSIPACTVEFVVKNLSAVPTYS